MLCPCQDPIFMAEFMKRKNAPPKKQGKEILSQVPRHELLRRLSDLSMSGRLDIQWSPLHNKFITWGAEICLYEVHNADMGTPPASNVFKISDSTCAKMTANNTNNQFTRSIDIYPKCENDVLLALGQVNGRVLLSTFGPAPEYDQFGFPGKELIPRHGRPVNHVLFNPIEPTLLAVGLEKYRSDSSVLVWDLAHLSIAGIRANITSQAMTSSAPGAIAPAVEVIKPLVEFGTSEAACSITWFHGSSKILASGMIGKAIKVYDLRDPSKMVNSTFTKAIYGVTTNPKDDRYLASFFDNQISLWDIRNFEKPITILHHNKNLIKIAWCPTKVSCLGALQKESSTINVYDIKHTIVGTEDMEPAVMDRVIMPGSPHNITCFSWHPVDYNRMLTIALSGTIKDYKIIDRIAFVYSSNSNVLWTDGSNKLRMAKNTLIDDISNDIMNRAKEDYGLQEQFEKNAQMVSQNPMLKNVWNWLQHSTKLEEQGLVQDPEFKHPGAAHILSKINPEVTPSEVITLPWAELGYPNSSGTAKYFRHEERDKVLHMCSWPLDRDSPFLDQFLEHLEKAGAFSRAATIAVFNLKIPLAMEILSRIPDKSEYDSSLNLVSIALAGFSDDPNSVWRQNCLNCISNLRDPYLKAMFYFLNADNFNFDDVLNEKGIAMDDRVALVARYLPDDKLNDHMQRLCTEVMNDGNLDGLLVTGNSSDGLNILQKYLDNTSDIQSTAVIAMRAFHKHLKSNICRKWFANYTDLLDHWTYYFDRAAFDIMFESFLPDDKPDRQVFISCNYCGKSISLDENTQGKSQRASSSKAQNLTACPHCRKPLPRCSVCCKYLGGTIPEDDSSMANTIGNWITWCQTCRHGGHCLHLETWFEEHTECPVSGCTCRCNSLDASAVFS